MTAHRQTLAALDAAALRRWCRDGAQALAQARAEIDALNVFPVPDGDTGTNLFLTIEAAADAVEDDAGVALHGDDVGATALALARGALLGARGNSGVIVSQMLRGLAETLAGAAPAATASEVFHRGLVRASDLAYAAVARPVEGTVLSVARAAADAAEAAPGAALADVVRAAAGGARAALERTPEQLEVLARAGVVDAGGRGLVVLLEALESVVTGVERPSADRTLRPAVPVRTGPDWDPATVGGPAFEVMYLLDAADDAIPQLRNALGGMGDSLVVVGGDRLWNVHVHVDDPGPAVEAGISAGRPYRIRITSLETPAARTPSGRGIVAVAPGAGLAALLESVGAAVVAGGAGRRPSPADLLAAMRQSGASEVVLLPNDKDSLAVAEAAAAEGRALGLRVGLIPTRAPVQSLAALAVHDRSRSFDDDVVTMTAAARSTRHAEVTVAVREAMTSAGVCAPGDVLGLIEDDVVVIGDSVEGVASDVLERMLALGGELVTLVRGEDAESSLVDVVTARLQRSRPDVEVVAYDGGQPHYPLLVGVE